MTAPITDSRRAAERALVDLEQLIARGDGDSDRADRLRQVFADQRRRVRDADRHLLDDLAGDLDSLSDREVADGLETPADVGVRLDAALRAHELSEFMRLLRSAPGAAPEWLKALWRGRGWALLGYHYAAAAFLERAIALNPGAPATLHSLRLEELFRGGQLPQAVSEARRLLKAPVDPIVSITALSILYQETLTLPEAERGARYQEIASELEATLKHAPGLASAPRARTAVMRAHLIRAYSYERLQRFDDAARAFDAAVDTSPGNVARIARGVFRALRKQPGAEDDLRAAIETGTTVATPYALLAFIAADTGRLDEAIDLGQAALERAFAPQHRALIMEILAIAYIQMNPPRVEEARSLLTFAIALAPQIDRLRRNLALISSDEPTAVSLDPSVIARFSETDTTPFTANAA